MLKSNTQIFFRNLIRHIFLAWLIAANLEYFILPPELRSLEGTAALQNVSLLRAGAVFVFATVLLSVFAKSQKAHKTERWCIAGLFAVLAFSSLLSSFTWAFLVICAAVAMILVYYVIHGWDNSETPQITEKPTRRWTVAVTAAASVAAFIFLAVNTAGKVYSFKTASYDFGIFAQMFYYMKETGIQYTTIERSRLLSHMNVHVSPIFYLLLPFYYVVPTPATLQVLQAAVLISAVIPLWKIGKLHGLEDWQRMLVCIIMLLAPAFSGGAYYDIHENCFLTPLILWLLYAADAKKTPLIFLFTILTLMVKEDAAVYVTIIALWMIINAAIHPGAENKKDILKGAGVLIIALLWFLIAIKFLANVGDGVMIYRYNNFFYEGAESLYTVVKAAFLLPLKAIYECVDTDKLSYICWTLLPLMAMPVITRRYERYILMIPYILINLMTDYKYQYGLYQQYSFGSFAMLMYLTTVNIADIKIPARKLGALIIAGILSLTSFVVKICPGAVVIQDLAANHKKYTEIRHVLEEIPEEASVAGSADFTTTVSQRKVLYDVLFIDDDTLLDCDYVILAEGEKDEESIKETLEDGNFEVIKEIPGVFKIYKK